jgi:hypothetical protein
VNQGKPVRFLGAVLSGWIAIRITVNMAFLPSAEAPPDPARHRPLRPAAKMARRGGMVPPSPTQLSTRSPAFVTPSERLPGVRAILSGRQAKSGSAPFVLAARVPGDVDAPKTTLSLEAPAIPAPQSNASPMARRWSGAAWLLWRGEGGGTPLARGGRLGASQAGLRIDYALAPASSLHPAVYGRLSSALEQPYAAEAAVGIAIRPKGLPVSLGVERRAALSKGARDDFALVGAGGLYRTLAGGRLRLDGYGQAGFVDFSNPDAFVDGRLTVEAPIVRRHGAGDAEVSLGGSISGGAQPGLSRLDIGPVASIRMPLGPTYVRITAEWRQRIAGDAHPASGPALTLGADF